VSGSPFATGGTQPISVAFSPSGTLLAVANGGGANGPGSVSVFSVNSTGALTQVEGSPFAAGAFPWSVAFSPSGTLLAVADQGANGPGAVSVFSVSSAGVLTQVAGSPVTAVPNPQSVAFSPSGRLLAVAHGGSRTVSVFSVSYTNAGAPPIEASNQIVVSHVKAQRDGTISFQAKVPGPGTVDMLETAWDDNLARAASVLQPAARRFATGRAHADATTAGVLHLQVSVNAQGEQLIRHHRYAVVLRLWVTYTPTGGSQTSVGFYGLHLRSRCPDATSSGERTKTNCAAYQISDNFNGTSLNSSVWATIQGAGTTEGVQNGSLQLTASTAAASGFYGGIQTNCQAIGDFDAQIRFTLSTWPADDNVTLAINSPVANTYMESAVGGDIYGLFVAPPSSFITIPGSVPSGELRLARRGDVISAYIRSSHAGKWHQIGHFSGSTIATWVGVFIWNLSDFGGQPVSVQVDSFKLDAAGLSC
jgi:hypothetical protein